jgi:hypothetical protein
MAHNSDNLCVSPGSDFSVQTFHEVKSTSPKLPSPSFVANAMSPEVVMVEWGERFDTITHEAASSMSVKAEHEGNEQMMRIPERLEGLLANLGMSRRVHEKHA